MEVDTGMTPKTGRTSCHLRASPRFSARIKVRAGREVGPANPVSGSESSAISPTAYGWFRPEHRAPRETSLAGRWSPLVSWSDPRWARTHQTAPAADPSSTSPDSHAAAGGAATGGGHCHLSEDLLLLLKPLHASSQPLELLPLHRRQAVITLPAIEPVTRAPAPQCRIGDPRLLGDRGDRPARP